MAWPNAGYSSPRTRRTSRPLSMICENPDDLNNAISLTIPGDKIVVSRSSPKVSRAAPTRRKAVAPLQHPVTVLLDSQFDSSTLSNTTSSCNGSQELNKPAGQSTGSSKVKTLLSNTTRSKNNEQERQYSSDTNNSPPSENGNFKSYYYHTILNNDNDNAKNNDNNDNAAETGILTDIINSSDLLDRNHNHTRKTDRLKETIFTDVYHSSTIPTIYLTQSGVLETSPSSMPYSDGDDYRRDNTQTSMVHCNNTNNDGSPSNSNDSCSNDNVNDDDSLDVSNNNFGNSSYLSEISKEHPATSDSGILFDSITTNHSSSIDTNDSPVSCSNDVHNSTFTNSEHSCYNSDIIINNKTNAQADLKTCDTDFMSSEDFYTFDHNVMTSTPKTVTSLKQHRNQPCYTSLQHQFHHEVTHSLLLASTNTSTNASPKSRCTPRVLRHNKSDSDVLCPSTSLDGDTMEWKKRVTRSISLIKIPYSPQKGLKRRVSSINPSTSSCDNDKYSLSGLKGKNNIVSNIPKYHQDISSDGDDMNSSQSGEEQEQEPIRRISAIDQSDFSLLKVATARLNLPTRRTSTTAWKEKYLNGTSPFKPILGKRETLDKREDNGGNVGDSGNRMVSRQDWKLTEDDKNRMNGTLAWLRQELIDIRLQDQSLARQFLNLRNSMNAFRLAVQCENHQELIDDAEEDIEELRELSQLVDIPPEIFSPLSPLKHVGITRMNISSRRFSTC